MGAISIFQTATHYLAQCVTLQAQSFCSYCHEKVRMGHKNMTRAKTYFFPIKKRTDLCEVCSVNSQLIRAK